MIFYNRKDIFYQKAKKEGFVARSAYKLIELDKRFEILKPGRRIVDLGCAPGGWIQVAEGKLARIVGIDLLPLKFTPSSNTLFFQGNFLDPVNQQKIIDALQENGERGSGFASPSERGVRGRQRQSPRSNADWVLSDMSPNLSGIKFKDLQASLELCESALEFAKKILKKGGGLVVKIFPGPEMENFRKRLRELFERMAMVEPEATRKTSAEIYLVCTGFKG